MWCHRATPWQAAAGVRVDDATQRLGIAGFRDVPIVDQRRLPQGCSPAGLRHAGEPRLIPSASRRVSGAIVAGAPGALVREAVGEAGPGVEVEQHIGNAGGRQPVVQGDVRRLHVRCGDGAQRRNRQPALVEANVGQFGREGLGGYRRGSLRQHRAPPGEHQQPRRAHRFDRGSGQQVIVERAEAGETRHSYVAGGQAFVEQRKDAQLVACPAHPVGRHHERPRPARHEPERRVGRQLPFPSFIGGLAPIAGGAGASG